MDSLFIIFLGLIGLYIFIRTYVGFKKFRAAMNALAAKHTYLQLQSAQKEEVVTKSSEIIQRMGLTSSSADIGNLNEKQIFSLFALAMAELELDPAISSFEWQYVHHPFSALLNADKQIEAARRQILKTDDIDISFGSESFSDVQHQKDTGYNFSPNMPDIRESEEIEVLEIGTNELRFYGISPTIGETVTGNSMPINFRYVLMAVDKQEEDISFYITVEQSAFEDELFLCAFDTEGRHLNFGSDDRYREFAFFKEQALQLALRLSNQHMDQMAKRGD